MITVKDFQRIIELLGAQGQEDIMWAENLCEPVDAQDFALEAIFVICNSGMKNTVARKIFNKCRDELTIKAQPSAHRVFAHRGKANAINDIWDRRGELLEQFRQASDKLEFCASLPWIGDITKYHLAKNFGADVAKPDVHLQRLADREGVTPQALCERLAAATGYRIATVDTLLWRACAEGVINSKTGAISPP